MCDSSIPSIVAQEDILADLMTRHACRDPGKRNCPEETCGQFSDHAAMFTGFVCAGV
jgi:hypothetical protein